MSAGGWGCPHEVDGTCSKIADRPCDPGMKGCELYGRFVFFDPDKNRRLEQKRPRDATPASPSASASSEKKKP